jgi:bifunctional lysine-specific demethylase and histidyl-hydroxylase NO66
MNPFPEALARCVGDPDRFMAEVWTRSHHLHRDPGGYADLLSLEHVDHLVASMSLRWPAFRLVKEGRTLPRSSFTRSGTVGGVRVDDLIDVGRVHAAFADGATIVLQGLHRYWPPVSRFCRDLESFLTHPVQANAYVTPPVASGLKVHHDTHDVFALQTHGRKHWVVHKPVVESPLESQRWSPDDHDPGEPVLDTVLEPGDCLYVPRGTPHAARTIDAASVHLTVGIRQQTWHDVLEAVLEEAATEASFRESLPAGFADDPESLAPLVAARLKDAAAWLEQEVDAGSVAQRVAGRFWTSRMPHLEGGLADILRLAEISDETVLTRRTGVDGRVRADRDEVVIDLGDREVAMPVALEGVVERVFAADSFRPSDLADVLDAESRLVLARRLVREGLFTTGGE